jgi:DNA sulfur modification protein DndB
LTTLEYGEVDTLVILPEEFLGDRLLDDSGGMQRKLSWGRVRNEMKKYLLECDNAFYSALTLFIVPRDLTPMREGEGYEFRPTSPQSRYGQLALQSTCVLFPGDGQHRAASIKAALQEDPSLAGVNVPVVLIPFRSVDQVRQLFSDLNLNAKPINKSIGLSFETRDPLAIISKRVAQDVPLFNNRVNRRTNSLPFSSANVITMNTLVESNDILLTALNQDIQGVRSKPTDDPEVLRVTNRLVAIWNLIISSLPEWDQVLAGKKEPGTVREEYVFAHGLGWQAIARVASVVIKGSESWQRDLPIVLKTIDWRRRNQEWQKIAIMGKHMNNTGTGIRASAGYILEKGGITNQDAKPYLDTLCNCRGI